jgi:hypothetical protein
MPPAPTVYEAGHIKRNVETGEVALRTIFPEDQGPQMANMAWLVATKNVGARNCPTSEVTSWVDVFTPTPPPPVTPPAGE